MLKFLREPHRNRIIQAHRVAKPMAAFLTSFAETLAAVGELVDDDRWNVLAATLDACAADLRKLG